MKKYKGFTLVEVLAIVAVMGFLLVIVVPKVNDTIKQSRLKTMEMSTISIAKNAENIYNSNYKEDSYYLTNPLKCSDVGSINLSEYGDCSIAFNNGKATVSMVGKENGKFDGIACYGTKDDMQCQKVNWLTVTFDANGGTVDTNTKEVYYSAVYGELPTPTREGYTFKGWNGKNMLNLDVLESMPSNLGFDKTNLRTFIPNTYVKGLAYNNYYASSNVYNLEIKKDSVMFVGIAGYGIGFVFLSENNQNYSFSFESTRFTNGVSTGSSVMFYSQDGALLSNIHISGPGKRTHGFSVPNEAYYLVVEFYGNCSGVHGDNLSVYFNNIQLEKGTEATEYEPYYITSDTKVVQDKNHTLKAIWEANS